MEITLELSCEKFPAAKDYDTLWEDNKKALMAYMYKVEDLLFLKRFELWWADSRLTKL